VAEATITKREVKSEGQSSVDVPWERFDAMEGGNGSAMVGSGGMEACFKAFDKDE